METGFNYDEAEGNQKKRRIIYRRFLLRYIAGVIVPSLNLKDIAKNIWKVPSNKIFYFPNGVDCNNFSPGKAYKSRQMIGIKDEACVIGLVAHLRPVKNIGLLIKSFAKIRKRFSLHLIIIGDGLERKKLMNLAKKLGVKENVYFLGHRNDLRECYRMMDIFALSSKSEQMSVSILEAMATGLPIVSTDVGDIKKMVDDENRCFIVPQNYDALYEVALEQLVIDKEKRTYLGIKNRQKCLKVYRHEQMIFAYYNFYKRILSL